MKYLFIEYPKCSTCQKAKAWLQQHQIDFDDRHIVLQNPSKIELTKWIKISGRPVKSFFNTSGLKYKELDLKNKLSDLNEAQQIDILASDGMLIKRPLLIGDKIILNGFKPVEWAQSLNVKKP